MSAPDLNAMFGVPTAPEPANNAPAVSLAWGLVFQHLGGHLGVDRTGRRYLMKPEPASFRLSDKELPSFPDAEPHERFLNGDEYRGALKLITGLLDRISADDADLVYTLLGSVSVDEGKFIPTIAEPVREVAK